MIIAASAFDYITMFSIAMTDIKRQVKIVGLKIVESGHYGGKRLWKICTDRLWYIQNHAENILFVYLKIHNTYIIYGLNMSQETISIPVEQNHTYKCFVCVVT